MSKTIRTYTVGVAYTSINVCLPISIAPACLCVQRIRPCILDALWYDKRWSRDGRWYVPLGAGIVELG